MLLPGDAVVTIFCCPQLLPVVLPVADVMFVDVVIVETPAANTSVGFTHIERAASVAKSATKRSSNWSNSKMVKLSFVKLQNLQS